MATLAQQYAAQISGKLPGLAHSQGSLEILLACVTNATGTEGIEGMASVSVIAAGKKDALEDLELTLEITSDKIQAAAEEVAKLVFEIIDQLAAEFTDLTGYTVDGGGTGFNQAFALEQKEHDGNETFAKQVKTEVADAMTKLGLVDPNILFAPKPVTAAPKSKIEDVKTGAANSLARAASFFVEAKKTDTPEAPAEEAPGWKSEAVISPDTPAYKKLAIVTKVLKATNNDAVAAQNTLDQKNLGKDQLLKLFETLWTLADKQLALSAAVRGIAKADYERFQAQAASAKMVVAILDKVTKFFGIKLD